MRFRQIAVFCALSAFLGLCGDLSGWNGWLAGPVALAAEDEDDEEEDDEDYSGGSSQQRLDQLRGWLNQRHQDRGENVPYDSGRSHAPEFSGDYGEPRRHYSRHGRAHHAHYKRHHHGSARKHARGGRHAHTRHAAYRPHSRHGAGHGYSRHRTGSPRHSTHGHGYKPGTVRHQHGHKAGARSVAHASHGHKTRHAGHSSHGHAAGVKSASRHGAARHYGGAKTHAKPAKASARAKTRRAPAARPPKAAARATRSHGRRRG